MANDDLTVTHEPEDSDAGAAGSAQRVRVAGELDVAGAPRLAAVFQHLIDSGATLVLLDASNVRFVDSSGLRTVIAAGNQLAERGGKLLIEGMSSAMEKLLEITGLIDSYRA